VAVAALAQRDMRSSRPQGGSGRDVLARSVPPTGAECDGRPGAPWRCRGATSSPADRHEVVYANAYPAFAFTAVSVAVSKGTFAFAIAAFCSSASFRSPASVIFCALAIAPVFGSATTSMKSLPFIV